MISVDEAWTALAETPALTETEDVALGDAAGRVLAQPVIARRTQPPRDMSAMDGYAVAFGDIEDGQTAFTVIGEAPAGGAFERAIESGEAVRIFTGGVVPEGADHIIIQEDVNRDGDTSPSRMSKRRRAIFVKPDRTFSPVTRCCLPVTK